MSVEWIAVVVAIVTVGVAVVSGFRRINDALQAQGERLARIEGMIDTLQFVVLADRPRRDVGPGRSMTLHRSLPSLRSGFGWGGRQHGRPAAHHGRVARRRYGVASEQVGGRRASGRHDRPIQPPDPTGNIGNSGSRAAHCTTAQWWSSQFRIIQPHLKLSFVLDERGALTVRRTRLRPSTPRRLTPAASVHEAQ